MSDEPSGKVTAILQAVQAGNQEAAAQLLPLVYEELRRLAQVRMAQLPPGQTLQPTALVHEAYLRLVGRTNQHLESRRHFFFAAARAMRDILVEQARAKAGPKRGGGRRKMPLDEEVAVYEPPSEDVLAVHELLTELEREDPVLAQIVNLRYFVGMTVEETAQVLGLSERTIHRHWRFITAWMKSRLEGSAGPR